MGHRMGLGFSGLIVNISLKTELIERESALPRTRVERSIKPT